MSHGTRSSPQRRARWPAIAAGSRSSATSRPATVLTAGFDPLSDEGVAYADRLRDPGVPVDLRAALAG